ncbi:c-type cytochrome [Edaphobacter albus]|uniref:c-type cytochrome n=1 Tax=Edaphobacter sp. 4G125 TaxID=2763071 RepID=UPI00164542CC|nr:c-type cytochrome [Edaphobacter sp. 4G125]QNI37116.1 c-type cytochrome [Edaphobacter sp. 4G125]
MHWLPRPFGRCVSFASAILLTATLAGCRQDMHDQPKFFPQRGTSFYADGRSVRPQVVNTVARSQGEAGSYFMTGMVDGAEGDGMPYKVTLPVLERGQERYNVYCTPCHSRVGNGKGMIVQRGYYAATSFHSYRLRQAPLGHFFNVISNGYGAMPDYAAQIRPEDRWAIAAYIRALQLSQNAAGTDVPSGARVVPISAVEESNGFSSDFLNPWVGSAGSSTSSAPAVASAPAISATTSVTASAKAPETVPAKAAAQPPVAVTKSAKNIEVASATAPAAPQAAAPEKPAAKGDASHGKEVYGTNCSMCHQPTRAGMPPVFPSLIGVVDRVGEKHVRTVAKEGIPDAKPPMPPHPNLTDKDLDDLLAFLKTKP